MQPLEVWRLAPRFPLIGDRALAEVVNALNTMDDMVAAGEKEGFLRRCVSRFTGVHRRRGLERDRASATVQRSMVAWTRELSEHLRFTDINVGLLAMEIEELQHEVAHAEWLAHEAMAEVRELAGIMAEFIDAVDLRFAQIDRKIAEIDRRLAFHEQVLGEHGELLVAHTEVLDAHARALLDLDRRALELDLWRTAWAGADMAVRRWRNQDAYSGLPWAAQVTLLAREVAMAEAGLHEFITGERSWRERLADDILSDPRAAVARRDLGWDGTRTMRRIVERATEELRDPDERRLVAELLGVGLPANLRPPHRPMGFALARALELSARDPGTRPEDPSRTAVDEARRDYGHLSDVTFGQFVRRTIDEQAEAARQARADLREERLRREKAQQDQAGRDSADG